MSDEIHKVAASSLDPSKIRAQQARNVQNAELETAVQVEGAELAEDSIEYAVFNPMAQSNRFKTLQERNQKQPVTKSSKDSSPEKKEEVEEIAKVFEAKNPELRAKSLATLHEQIALEEDDDSLIETIFASYPDDYLVDETLDFLIQSHKKNISLHNRLIRLKERWNKEHERTIFIGKNISQEAQAFSKEGLGSPTSLRSLYKDVTEAPQEALDLFEELLSQFDFEKMKPVIAFVLHSLGSDLKSKGPSIDPKVLQVLFSQTRVMQAILGVFRFFFSNMDYLQGQCTRQGLHYPSNLSFEVLARHFVLMIREKYPSPEKILRLAISLGISEDLLMEIIIFTLYRDAMRQVAPRLFKNERHRQDLLMAILEAIELLDEELEDQDQKDEDQDQKDEDAE